MKKDGVELEVAQRARGGEMGQTRTNSEQTMNNEAGNTMDGMETMHKTTHNKAGKRDGRNKGRIERSKNEQAICDKTENQR